MNRPPIPLPQRRVSAKRASEIFAHLAKTYPDAKTALLYRSPFELLIAVILSAQTTDAIVNRVTPDLFAAYPDPAALAAAPVEDVDRLIQRIGLHHAKSRYIVETARRLVEEHHGTVPQDRAALEALPGVGRKTASVVLSVAFEEAAFAVDTHVFRVAHRLGLSLGSTPRAVEEEVTRLLPPALWRHAHHWLILHGRAVCRAPIPSCERCPLADLCPSRRLVARYRAVPKAKKAKRGEHDVHTSRRSDLRLASGDAAPTPRDTEYPTTTPTRT